MRQYNTRIFNVLYADDNHGDIELASEALDAAGLHCNFFSVKNGEEALNFLYRRAPFDKDTPQPHLILLDWNMPKVNGLEVLKLIKDDKHLQAIPAIIFTSSSRQKDIHAAYQAGANCYVVKPTHLDLFLQSITSIIHYWGNVAN